jgi:CDP-6-deoxy-D-xylo-4-hexulose-3-dehydrase
MNSEEIKKIVNQNIQRKTWIKGKDWVQYAGPYFTSEEYVEAIRTLLDGWLVLGPKAIEFERKFPKKLGKDKGILTNSGSSANLIALRVLIEKYNLKSNSKVITPVAGFPTTVNPIIQCGLTPLFVDIELPSLNIDIFKLSKIKDGRVLMLAHALGNPVDLEFLSNNYYTDDLLLIEDCCDALGATYYNNSVGTLADIATCSFYPAHHITMGEGGFVATNDSELERIARSFRDWGRGCYCCGKEPSLSKTGKCSKRFSNWLESIPNEEFDHKYIYDRIGYNLKPIELQAAIGLVQLKKLPEIVKIRNNNFKLLYNIFKKYESFFYLPVATKDTKPSWFAFPLTLKENIPFNRNKICKYLEDNKIQTRPYFAGNILLHPAYKNLPQAVNAAKKFPVATYVTLNTFFLGVSPVITQDMIDYIEEVVERFFKSL